MFVAAICEKKKKERRRRERERERREIRREIRRKCFTRRTPLFCFSEALGGERVPADRARDKRLRERERERENEFE